MVVIKQNPPSVVRGSAFLYLILHFNKHSSLNTYAQQTPHTDSCDASPLCL